MIFQDEKWKNLYPDGYKFFTLHYGHTVISLHMTFLKRMRRHKAFPGNGNFLPIFDLKTGCILCGYRFLAISNTNFSVECWDGSLKSVGFFKNLTEVWKFFEGKLEESLERAEI
jgi:hypothetical protein